VLPQVLAEPISYFVVCVISLDFCPNIGRHLSHHFTNIMVISNLFQKASSCVDNSHYQKKKIRIGFINNLAPVLKVSGTKCFITGVKIKALELVL
jgi:hypothetical protein